MAANAEDDDSWLYGGKEGSANNEAATSVEEPDVPAVKEEPMDAESVEGQQEEALVKAEPSDAPMEPVSEEVVGDMEMVQATDVKSEQVDGGDGEGVEAQVEGNEAQEESAVDKEGTGEGETQEPDADAPPAQEGQAEGEDDDEEEDEDDDVQIHIGEIKAYETPKFKGPYQRPAAKGPTKGVDVEAVGTINETPVYEFDLDILNAEDKPWRKPGADITDYFNYGFNEDTWKQYCEKQRRLRIDNNSGIKVFMPNKSHDRPVGNQMGNMQRGSSNPMGNMFRGSSNPGGNMNPAGHMMRGAPSGTDFIQQRMEALQQRSTIPSISSHVPTTINVIGSRRPDMSGFPDGSPPFSQAGGSTPPPPGVPLEVSAVSSSMPSVISSMINTLANLPPPIVTGPPPILMQGPPNLAMPPPGMNVPPPSMNVPPPGIRLPPPNLGGPPPTLATPANVAQMVLAANQLFRGPPPNMQGPPPNMQNFPPFRPPPGPGGPPPPMHRGPPPGFHQERPNYGYNHPPPQGGGGPPPPRFARPHKSSGDNDWMNLPLSDDDLSGGSDEDERRMKRERDRDGMTRDVRERDVRDATREPPRDVSRSKRERSKSRSRSRSRERRSHRDSRDSRHRSSRRERESSSRHHNSPSKPRESSRSHRLSRREPTPPANRSPSASKVTNMTEVPAS